MRFIALNCFILVFGLLQVVNAASKVACIPMKLMEKNKNIILAGPEKSAPSPIYFFKNIGKQGIWLDHPSNRSMNAGWSSFVRTGNWSALLLNRKEFAISCAVIEPGKAENLDCTKVVTVCMPKEAAFKTMPKGTYWLAEDKAWDDIIKAVEKRGITLK
jgi:hypothetical protein